MATTANPQFPAIPENRMLKLKPTNRQLNEPPKVRGTDKENRRADKTRESWPGSERRRIYDSMKETKGILSETAYNDYKSSKGPADPALKKRSAGNKTTITVYNDRQNKSTSKNNEKITITALNTGRNANKQEPVWAKNKHEATPEKEKLPEIANEKGGSFYPKGYIPASYTIHRPPAVAKEPTDGDLSTVTKLEIVDKYKQLIYKETQLTKAKVEKLKAYGCMEHDVYIKLRKVKEDRRWDLLTKSLHEQPKNVHALWEFFQVEYRDLHSIMQQDYLAAIREHFQPRLANLKSTPANLLKMSDILLEITEEYDVKVRELEKTVGEKDKQLLAAKQLLHKTKTMVLSWGQRELMEDDDDDVRQMAQQILDAINEISSEKENEISQLGETNEELKKKVSRLTKALKEKDKKLQDLKQAPAVGTPQTGSQRGSQLSLGRKSDSHQHNED